MNDYISNEPFTGLTAIYMRSTWILCTNDIQYFRQSQKTADTLSICISVYSDKENKQLKQKFKTAFL